MRLNRRSFVAASAAAMLPAALYGNQARYEDIFLSAPDGRTVALRTVPPRRPDKGTMALIFSHGANGTWDGLKHIVASPLARRRWVFMPLHVDSEAHASHGTLPPPEVWRTRVEDMRLAIDHAVRRMGIETPIVAAGHSYGALVAQALGGATVMGQNIRDERVRAVIALSPPGPLPGFVEEGDWAKMAVSMLVTTGTADVLPMIAPTWQAHLASFAATTISQSAAWVGRDVDHYFGRMIQRLDRRAPDQRLHFDAAMHIADRYLNAVVAHNAADLKWLAEGGPKRAFSDVTDSFDWRP